MRLIDDIRKSQRNISLEELDYIIDSVYKEIKKDKFVPDHIFYIERAGRLIGHKLAKKFSCPYTGIVEEKRKNKKREFLIKVFQSLSKKFIKTLKILERTIFFHRSKKEIDFKFVDNINTNPKEILIVDDAIDTGLSMANAIDFLNENLCLNTIKIAVITETFNDSSVTANFSYLNKTICTFPWSIDSKEYYNYLKIYNSIPSGSKKK